MSEFFEKLKRLEKHCNNSLETGFPKRIREEHEFILELIKKYKKQDTEIEIQKKALKSASEDVAEYWNKRATKKIFSSEAIYNEYLDEAEKEIK